MRLQPTTVQNVVTYQTVIAVPNQQLKLKPGMTANVTIEVNHKTNVLRIPSAATRFRPTADVFAALHQEMPPEARGGFGGRNAGGRGGGGRGGNGSGQPGGGAPGGAPAGGAPAANAATAPAGQPTTAARVPAAGSAEARGGGDRWRHSGSDGRMREALRRLPRRRAPLAPDRVHRAVPVDLADLAADAGSTRT